MGNKNYARSSAAVVMTVFIALVLLLTGCSKLVNQLAMGTGSIALTLSRAGSEYASTSTVFSEHPPYQTLRLSEYDFSGIDPAELPRSVAQVLSNIDAYLVRIEGDSLDSCKYYPFEEGQEELTATIELPAGSGYLITLLALTDGGEGEKRIIGTGRENFAVIPEQVTTIQVLMQPCKYAIAYPDTFSPETGLPLSFYIWGQGISDIFELTDGKGRLYYTSTEPEGNFNQEEAFLTTEITQLSALDSYDCFRFEVQIPAAANFFDISSSGGEETYTSYFQLELGSNEEWQESITEAGLDRISLLTPDLNTGDCQEMVNAVAGDAAINPPLDSGTVATIAGAPAISGPEDIVIDSEGNLYLAQYAQVVKISPDGTITAIAGNGVDRGYEKSQDGGPAAAALLDYPMGLALDEEGNLYIADVGADVIRKVSPDGIISTAAGTGEGGYNGDGIEATTAMLDYPIGVDVDSDGNIYIADFDNCLIRKVDTGGFITTVAGTGEWGYNGDGNALSTQLNLPSDVVVDSSGNVYIADHVNDLVRKLDVSTGVISTVAGGGSVTLHEESIAYIGEPTGVGFYGPYRLCLDSQDNLYIGDIGYGVIRKIENGVIKTVVGSGASGPAEDGASALETPVQGLNGLAVDTSGNIYFTDWTNELVSQVVYPE